MDNGKKCMELKYFKFLLWFKRWIELAQLVKNLLQCRRHRKHRFDPWVRKILWRRKWQPILVFLPEKSHGVRSLASYNPWGPKESDRTKMLSTMLWNAHHTLTSIRGFFLFFSFFFSFHFDSPNKTTHIVHRPSNLCLLKILQLQVNETIFGQV